MYELENLKNIIEKMEKKHHIEILRILNRDSTIKLNENKNGVYINMSFLPENTLEEIHKYVKYIQMQEDSLQDIETKKDDFKHTFFSDE